MQKIVAFYKKTQRVHKNSRLWKLTQYQALIQVVMMTPFIMRDVTK